MAKHIIDVFEDKARGGEGSFAIAYALMQLNANHERLATMVGRLGFDCLEHPGGLEGVAMELHRIADAMQQMNVSASVSIEQP